MKELKVRNNMLKIDWSNPYLTRKKGELEEVIILNAKTNEEEEYIEWLKYEIRVYEHRIDIAKQSLAGYESVAEAWRDVNATRDYFSIKRACTDYEECLAMLKDRLDWVTVRYPEYVKTQLNGNRRRD